MSRVGVPMRAAAAKNVYEESPSQPLHTVKVLHLDPTYVGKDMIHLLSFPA